MVSNDEPLLREFTPRVCEAARLFAWRHVWGRARRHRVCSRACAVVSAIGRDAKPVPSVGDPDGRTGRKRGAP